MSAQASPTSSSTARITIPVMGVCIGLSVLVHLGSAFGAGAYLAQRPQLDLSGHSRIALPDMPQPINPEEQQLRLGRNESSTASIAWLGIVKDEVLGQGQESQVEQAELTIQQGEQDSQAVPIPQPSISNEPVPQPPIEQTQSETIETEQIAEPEPQPEAIVPTVEPEPEPIEAESPINADEPEPVIESSETDALIPVIPQQPSAQPEADPEEPVEQPEPTNQTTERTLPINPTTSGKPGEEDQRESVASIIKRAQEVRATTLNRPLSGEGLEIRPKVPDYPATTRFTQLPRNPIVMIRFNAQGRVVKAWFLRDEKKKRIYDTGSKGVDEPLISAIYKWRASGKQIDALDPDDPESLIEISMKIIFRPDDQP